MNRSKGTPHVAAGFTAAFVLVAAAVAVASAPEYDLLKNIPASDYHVALVVRPGDLFAAPLIADPLATDAPRRVLAKLEGLKNLTGIDAKTDLDAVVLAGNPPTDRHGEKDGILLVRGRLDKTRLTELVAKAPDYAEKKAGEKSYCVFYSPHEDADRAAAFLDETTLVLGCERCVVAALEHGGALAGSLADEPAMKGLSGVVPSDAGLWILVRSPKDIVHFPKARAAATQVERFAAWVVVKDTVTAETLIVADSAEHARAMGNIVEGFLSLATLRLDAAASEGGRVAEVLKPVVDKVRATVDDVTVKVSVELTGEELMALRQVRERIGEHVRQAARHHFRDRAEKD